MSVESDDAAFDIDIVVHVDAVGHVAQSRFVRVHVVLVIFIIDDGFSKVDTLAIFAAHVEFALEAVLANFWNSVFVVDDGVVVSEYLVDLSFHEVVVCLDVVFGNEVCLGAHYFFDHIPVDVAHVEGKAAGAGAGAGAGAVATAVAHRVLVSFFKYI